jgi:hypothetical protein
VLGLPETVIFSKGAFSVTIDGLSITETGDVTIDLVDGEGQTVCSTNPMRVTDQAI